MEAPNTNEIKKEENIEVNSQQEKTKDLQQKESKCPCSEKQLLIIIIPVCIVVLFMVIFLPVYLKSKDDDNDDNDNSIDEFTEYVESYKYATLTPKNGYDNIYINLGGISETANIHIELFKSTSTFVPKGTKIYFLTGNARVIKFMEKYSIYIPVPCWFNVDTNGMLICENCDGDDFKEAKESLTEILDKIDEIKEAENIDYKNIYLGGFSQGGIMTNYVLLNSRHELGGYLPFSGYVFDHNFPANSVPTSLSDTQKAILDARKNYHILASHSFNDDTVPYPLIIPGYYTYYKEYTDFQLLSFGLIKHVLETQPTLPIVKRWLKESMGK